MTGVRKFLFDHSFDVVEKPEEEIEEENEEAEPEEVVPSFSEEELNAAKEEAFAAGKEEGVQEASATTEREILGSLSALGGRFGEVFKAQDEANTSILENAISVAASIAQKVFPYLNERHGLSEIERMVVTTIEKILEEPRIIVYLNPELVDPFTERLSTLTAQASYKGEVQVVAGEDIPSGDCRVVWSGGGAKRDTAELWREIDEIVERNLAGGEEDIGPEAPVTEGDEAGAPEAAEAAEAAETDGLTDEAPPPPDGAEGTAETQAEAGGEAPVTEGGEAGAPEAAEAAEAAETDGLTDEAPPPPDGAEAPAEIQAEAGASDSLEDSDAGAGGAEREPAEAQDAAPVEPGPEDAIVDDGMDERPESPADTPVEDPAEEPEPPVDGPKTPGADDTATDPEDT